ncbi:hypothetical protein [Kitasatospora sp. MBT63]|uniref:hypothetical protein n=1 Tax=Kitasatospora sp. MBT63 TaxID=1444768 RepID=UPI00053B45B8|nr:hypothetical protein [Kitasatospora sp. MBT63]
MSTPDPQPLRRTVVQHLASGLATGHPAVTTFVLELLAALDSAGASLDADVDQVLAAPRPLRRPR